MTFKEYAERYLKNYDQVSFILAKAEKDEHSPFYHTVYETTPMRTVSDWLSGTWALDLNILNDEQPPIDWLSGAQWNGWYNKGWMRNLLVIKITELEILHPQEANSLLQFIDKEIEKKHHSSRK